MYGMGVTYDTSAYMQGVMAGTIPQDPYIAAGTANQIRQGRPLGGGAYAPVTAPPGWDPQTGYYTGPIYSSSVHSPSNLLANNIGDNGPAFAGALVLPSVVTPAQSVQADSHSQGTQQTTPTASSQSTNAPAQTQATQTQASGSTNTTAVDTGGGAFGLSGMEIMIGILGIGIALMSMGKGKR